MASPNVMRSSINSNTPRTPCKDFHHVENIRSTPKKRTPNGTPKGSPKAPHPSADPAAALFNPRPANSGSPPGEPDDIFSIKPEQALILLCRSIEMLIRVTGGSPLTPPMSEPNTPNIKAREQSEERDRQKENESPDHIIHTPPRSTGTESDPDGINMRKTPIGSPESMSPGQNPSPHIIGANMASTKVQMGGITRKFFSKQAPPVPLEEYLLRVHRYCPLSTAVYLAASSYIDKVAVIDRVMPVTKLNVHRLLLAGLRVASKAIEDQVHSHKRFSKVGGVTEAELGRLEISFCFLTNFELRVTEKGMKNQLVALREGARMSCQPGFDPRMLAISGRRGSDEATTESS
jgi:Cyclin